MIDNHFGLNDDQLPSEYFEKICDLENSLLKEKNLIKMENLARLYKIGVEYYSIRNQKKATNFLFKLQNLFSKKKTLLNELLLNKKYEAAYGRSEENEESIASLISKFEIKFNNALSIVNQDIRSQEAKSNQLIKHRKNNKMHLSSKVRIIVIIIDINTFKS